jgi:hypothetical protein
MSSQSVSKCWDHPHKAHKPIVFTDVTHDMKIVSPNLGMLISRLLNGRVVLQMQEEVRWAIVWMDATDII